MTLFYYLKDEIKNYEINLHQSTLDRLCQDIKNYDKSFSFVRSIFFFFIILNIFILVRSAYSNIFIFI